MSRTYKSQGVILKTSNYGEADKILTFYTPNYGKFRALAKGVRKITSRKSGNVEIFNQVTAFFHRGRNLDLLLEIQIVDSFKSWRKNLKKVAMAYYLCELVDRLTPDGQPNKQVFGLLVEFLGKIRQKDLTSLARDFEEELLDELGFGVPLNLRKSRESLQSYIEEISERRINSRNLMKNIS